MKVPFHGLDARDCAHHYCSGSHQYGAGAYPVFSGARNQRGAGIGSFLGGLARQALPFLKNTLFGLGRYALRSGGQMLDDVQGGANVKDAFHNRVNAAKRDAITKITGGQVGTGGRRRKRKRRSQTGSGGGGKAKKRRTASKRPTKRRRRRRSKVDFFG